MLFNRLHRVYAVWVQISDFAFFTTSVRFSTNTLAYLAYNAYKVFKAFMAFKRSRLNPVQNYRSVTSFSVDWPRTIRLVCVCKYFERLRHNAPGDRNPNTLKYKTTDKRVL